MINTRPDGPIFSMQNYFRSRGSTILKNSEKSPPSHLSYTHFKVIHPLASFFLLVAITVNEVTIIEHTRVTVMDE